jgi:hypothetical protein
MGAERPARVDQLLGQVQRRLRGQGRLVGQRGLARGLAGQRAAELVARAGVAGTARGVAVPGRLGRLSFRLASAARA